MAVHFRLLLYEVHSSGRVGFLCVLRRVVASARSDVARHVSMCRVTVNKPS